MHWRYGGGCARIKHERRAPIYVGLCHLHCIHESKKEYAHHGPKELPQGTVSTFCAPFVVEMIVRIDLELSRNMAVVERNVLYFGDASVHERAGQMMSINIIWPIEFFYSISSSGPMPFSTTFADTCACSRMPDP